jgi:CHAT domain-containing protein
VLVSLWSVDDPATAALMESFYSILRSQGDTPDPAEALRQSQARLRETTKWRDPYFWAAFILIGT